MDRKVPIFNDLFDVCARLKAIDEGYFIMYNLALKKYEIHNSKCSDTLQLVLPYNSLDARAVRHAQITRVENMDKLAKEMDRHNSQLDQKKSDAVLDEMQYKTKQITEYLSSGGVEIPPYNSI